MSEIQRHDKQKKYFENLFERDNLGHAYLFVGENTSDKKEFTEDFCRLLTKRGFENNPNIKLIRPKTDEDEYKIHIEDIRNLKSFMSLKPYSSEYKLAVIDNAETVTAEAANAMLKILEEPPRHSVLVLTSSKPKLLPRTILSRCESVVFPPLPESDTPEMKEALSELRKVFKQSMAERIKYAKQLHEKGNYADMVNLWLRSLRLQLADKPRSAPVLKKLLRLSRIISEPQYNHRIALENFFVNL